MQDQPGLFASSALPDGMAYRPEFLTHRDEAALLGVIADLPLEAAQYKEWRARRRIVSYGGRYDFNDRELRPAGPMPAFLLPLRARVAEWVGVAAERFSHALVAEYSPGTQLGWHRDVPDFEAVAGISLGGRARMRLRPYPPRVGQRAAHTLELEPRSAYLMTGAARWGWQHAISPTKELRYSITFRTLRAPAGAAMKKARRPGP